MTTATFSLSLKRHESLRGSLVASVLFHGGLVVLALVYGFLNFGHRVGWGDRWAKGSTMHVKTVPSLPGVPLPRPMLETPNTVHVENPGLYQAEPEPRLQPPPNAVEIQKFKNTEKPLPLVHLKEPKKVVLPSQERLLENKRIQKQKMVIPPNAIPTGAGGAPAMNYGQVIKTANGQGVLAIENGNFGEMYGWYVEAVKNRVSSNWLLSIISPNISRARRVYVEFDILRDGTITNVKLTQSSGVEEVDRSAERAVLASSPLPTLPPGYKGSDVHVSFYFDFHR